MKITLFFGVFTLLPFLPAQAPRPAKTPVKTSAAAAPEFKAIWEPVNFKKDIKLTGVWFVSAEQGWAVGDKNTIIHTTDGGKNWQVQLGGDPESSDRAMTAVLFLDAKNGWARDNVSLFQTKDGGASWGAISKLDGHHRGLTFISQSTGFVVEGDKIIRTDDGGKTWKPAWQCALDMEVQGLTRKLPCHLRDLSFAGAKLGFAYGELKGAKRAVLAVTKDGGSTWRAGSPDMMDSAGMRMYAWGETHALASMYNRKTLLTTDGGKTWVPVVADISGEAALYAMPGGNFGVSAIYHRKIAYTHNGGRSFSTREFPVPAQIGGLSFGDRRNGYIVGEHGMVYRYHVVPAHYSVPNMIAAPMPESR